jgi:superfamily I DNA/RNA helicase
LEKKINPNSILAVTFTNKAAQEMKHRLGEIISEMSLQSTTPALGGDIDFDMLIQNSSAPTPPHLTSPTSYQRIGTFHGVFLRLLKQDIVSLELGYTT